MSFLTPPPGGASARVSSVHAHTRQLPGGSRDSSVRRQHGGHACGVAKQIASFVGLTPPGTSIARAEPGRRCPDREQDGRGQQATVPVSARDQGGASGEAAAC